MMWNTSFYLMKIFLNWQIKNVYINQSLLKFSFHGSQKFFTLAGMIWINNADSSEDTLIELFD